ncbi:lytic exoenzyme target recognition domain-containing protein [Lactococcus lactis]|uniref:Phage lysin N-acetylmuramoyl-L-alanine amidase n=1 Tax=Lactococcus lactis subsp. lactis TaxID=1360 RepID=A0A0V8DX20_LACLL|nr:lytic exoenzyme target recognition domain-containing protein [Lactococcus lactis]KSU18123.1 Phage lysin N-acetylmuramoyl-L-alanine amidase [Lactococcus lactis subsp. lactis]
MKKFFYAIVLVVAMVFTGTIGAQAATYKVYKADAVSYQSGQYQIRCNAITPAVSDWSWLNNGIPVNKVNWVDASGKNIADGPDSNSRAGMYFTIDPTVKDLGQGHYEKNGVVVSAGTAGAVYWRKFTWDGSATNVSWLSVADLNTLLYGKQVVPPTPGFNPKTLATNFINAVKGRATGSVNPSSTSSIKLAGADVAQATYKGYSQCVALTEYYLSQHGKTLSGYVPGANAVANSKLKTSTSPVVGGLFSVPVNGTWNGVSVGGYGHTGIVISVKSGVSFTTLENNYAGGFYQVVHSWSDVSHAKYTVSL